MEVINWKGILEALLFAAGDEGLSVKQIASVLEITEYQATDIIESLKEEYISDVRGVQVIEIAGVFQMTTKKEHSDYLKKLVETSSTQGLSQAALETLAIIAYKQPITRAEIDEIRGVKTERPIHTLVTKVLIKEVGRAEGSGRAYLYGTTKEFLDYFGLNSIKELPPLSDNSEESFENGEADLFFEKFQQTIE
ncbi:SMC-Scp complex subunit ScpB [Peribacillus butanolivorans]|uniref:Segregation and condensation protein B n=1 Tax=Peribacillus butanolivorans TaxID=421767 RepID=A0AAX0RYP2_9BACI|nr:MULTISPECIES: SMC-Scp complex subunit ScpB [Peribacillus]KRF63462.1 segregation and condensation protein B [Bacillus sp. Soil768D1]AXN37395.1 SMC-Scp complex subunit ScpB [Peribacillus butanolivorans]KON69944.1 segregation and condensation protein B [Peribacillus butanolivorans]MBK5442412.1 SMC-Scp complex subunit ScpB [Peribacillus sp. TH24]MBK5462838.1 SMC-Scp complex subunit ScpB [Peribacillus sp. TH27]